MIYRNKHTGMLVRHLFTAHDVSEKTSTEVYCEMETGRMFTQRSGRFVKVYELVKTDPQEDINPKTDF